MIDIAPRTARAHPHRAVRSVDAHALHHRQVDDQPIVATSQPRSIVAAAAYGDEEFARTRALAAISLPSAPEELGSFLGLKTVLSTDPFPREYWGKRACALFSCYNGSAELVKRPWRRSSRTFLRRCSIGWASCCSRRCRACSIRSYRRACNGTRKGDYVKALPDEAIDVHIAQAANTPSELSLMHLYPIDGAVHRVGKDETGLECKGRDLVDGHRQDRSESPEGGGAAAVGQGLLGSRSLRSRVSAACLKGRVYFFEDPSCFKFPLHSKSDTLDAGKKLWSGPGRHPANVHDAERKCRADTDRAGTTRLKRTAPLAPDFALSS